MSNQALPNIRYFTDIEKQHFIANLPLVKGATINSLSMINATMEGRLMIPYTSSYNKIWTYQQLQAFAMQGIKVSQNKENGIPQFPYIYNLVGSSKAPEYKTYYERFLTTEKPTITVKKKRVKVIM